MNHRNPWLSKEIVINLFDFQPDQPPGPSTLHIIQLGNSPIKRSACALLIFTNSCCRNCKRFGFVVSVIKRFISSKSTADG